MTQKLDLKKRGEAVEQRAFSLHAYAAVLERLFGCDFSYTGHVTFYIAVPDVARAFEEILAHGGTHMMGPDQVPNGPVIGLFKDPAGHTIGLVQQA